MELIKIYIIIINTLSNRTLYVLQLMDYITCLTQTYVFVCATIRQCKLPMSLVISHVMRTYWYLCVLQELNVSLLDYLVTLFQIHGGARWRSGYGTTL